MGWYPIGEGRLGEIVMAGPGKGIGSKMPMKDGVPGKGVTKPVKKMMKADGGKKKRQRKATESYKSYLYRVLKQVHPEIGISTRSMVILNSFMNDIFERVCVEAANLVKANKKNTLSAREMQTAVRLVLPGELSKHAVSEGTKAVTKFTSA